ncbi:hypothetical protein CGCF415_v007693 [Colletotrichum fructicola]|nr:hypothetical protein CFRS1_v007875 [Colletotrichum fructicola]KAF4492765.1 hypothetical protein CGGC5_v000370 [Colletotrichum fructicola Nara gc5]KAF4899085.1 hypothetical protein CGCFRS4_v004015 [Colletotrichum fructicola]KAF4906953.1 hypothetical protein CGCF415_v007693 [Colletotrichum fructicola]KAF4936099.1 hypothetical protein CGCF245_v006924 [Colletotrichum fructicola]
MIVIPALYHEAPEAEWPFSININTVIALLTTLMRATMLVAVAEVIGQMKWRFFDDQQRPLSYLQRFDHASRGVLGSIKIIWVARSSIVTVVAALVMVTSVAVGPFTQQAVSTVSCSRVVPGVKASLPVSHYVPAGRGSVPRVSAGRWDVAMDMKGAMINGLVNPTSNDNRVQAVCETGNCTFPSSSTGVTHSSIGMCSSCFDTTSFISAQGSTGNTTAFGSTNYTLPNNQSLNYIDRIWFTANTTNLDWAEQSFPEGFAALAKIAFANVTTLSFTQAPCSKAGNGTILCPRPVRDFLVPNDQTRKDEVDVMAVSCVLYPCLRSYHAEVTRGTLVERIVSTEPAVQNMVEARSNLNDKDKSPDGSMATTYGNFTGLQIPCFVEGVEYDLNNISQVPHADMTSFNINGSDYQVPETCLYKVGGTYALALRNFLATDLLQGYCWFPSSAGGVPICQTQWWLAPLYHNLTATFDSVSDSFEQLAAAITTQFRITGTSNETFSLTGYKEAVIGSVLGTTVCTRFDWQWVLLPITLVFATAILLTVAVAQSWIDPAIPVWKTSILPILFYNKVDSSHNEGMPTLDLDELQKVAVTTKAKFQTRPSARIEGDFME